MKQQKLEQRVKEIFQRQGFEVEKKVNIIEAEKNGNTKKLALFSSEEFSEDEVLESNADIVFVDEEFESLKEKTNQEVSVLREQREEPDYDLPAYELIGDIAVINELNEHDREEVVKGIREHHPRVKTILLKQGGLKGEYRVGDYEKLFGEETETTHKEFGCRYRVDPTKVYFSERFATERKRVVDQIEDGERVLVMFAGVGPFSILAAREADPEKVVAVEKNPIAAEYLKENIRLNNVEETVEGIKGDVEEVVPELEEEFDRIIMPLPEKADKFLETAFNAAAENGIIHYYRFLEEGNWKELEKEIEDASESLEKDFKLLEKVECGERGPGIVRACIDVEIK